MNGIEVADAHCVGQLALKTTLRPAKGEHPAKYGVAVDSSIPVGPIDEVHESNSVWKSAEQIVLSSFSTLEPEKAQTQRSAELPRESPRPVVRMTALYREAKSLESPLYTSPKRNTERHRLRRILHASESRSSLVGWCRRLAAL